MSGIVDRLRDPRRSGQEMLRARAADEIERLQKRITTLEKMDRDAAVYVESAIALRTGFTGEQPYVGWKGLGLALKEALDERDGLRAEVARLSGKEKAE